LPAAADIEMLENGQFAKYDYANGVVNYTGAGEWLLVYNEVKVYRDGLGDADFAMIRDNYNARVYSPIDGGDFRTGKSRDYTDVVSPADPYEPTSTDDPFNVISYKSPKLMPEDTRMVPRLYKTDLGDIFTTNTVKETTLAVGDILVVGDDGYLTKTAGSNAGTLQW